MYKIRLEKFKIPTLGMSRNTKFNSFIANINNKILANKELEKKKYQISYKNDGSLQVPVVSTKDKILCDIVTQEYEKIKG